MTDGDETEASGRFEALGRRAQLLGVAVRGAFHPEPMEFAQLLPAQPVGTIVLLGFTGGVQWGIFAASAEIRDGLPHPLDRWSRRIIGALAREFGALDLYPDGAEPQLPFQRLAMRSEPVHRSPIGLLIHDDWGLWHAYRGALVLPDRIGLPAVAPSAHPCEACATKPCLSACPVSAFRPGVYDVQACVDHVSSAAGRDCRELGCRARRACPVGTGFSYAPAQARFHMDAFLRSLRIL